jgi:L-asparagine oxygenase
MARTEKDKEMKHQFPRGVLVYELSRSENLAIDELLADLSRVYETGEAPDFVRVVRRIAFSGLPATLVQFLENFYHAEPAAAFALTGFEVDDSRVGPTPAHWNGQPDRRSTLREELFFMLVGAVLGDVFAWSTLQDGHFIHNVQPIQGQEQEQSGHGSLALLAWHTEDGFHPYRCDYLGLMGIRNHDHIPTTFASVDFVKIPSRQKEILYEPRFLLRPDNEHLNQQHRDSYGEESNSELVAAVWSDPPAVAVLFGDPRRPFLRIDPIFMSARAGDHEAEEALRLIIEELDRGLEELLIDPGVVCFIDNYRAIHGRYAFHPRYDGTDRWLKKMLLTRDLRKSRGLRLDPAASVLIPTLSPFEVRRAQQDDAGVESGAMNLVK